MLVGPSQGSWQGLVRFRGGAPRSLCSGPTQPQVTRKLSDLRVVHPLMRPTWTADNAGGAATGVMARWVPLSCLPTGRRGRGRLARPMAAPHPYRVAHCESYRSLELLACALTSANSLTPAVAKATEFAHLVPPAPHCAQTRTGSSGQRVPGYWRTTQKP
jgi:hypothetical protein